MKTAGIVWAVIVNLFTIGIAFGLYDYLYGSEVIIVSLLILIYVTVIGFYIQWGRTTTVLGLGLAKEFIKIRKLISKEEDNFEETELEELNKKLDDAQPKFWINAIGTSILWLIAIWHIITY